MLHFRLADQQITSFELWWPMWVAMGHI